MNVVGDLVARDRRSDALAVRTDSRAGSYSYEKLCTNAWKAGNLLRHYGVRGGTTVSIDAADPVTPQPLTAFFGAALLGATVRFDPVAVDDSRVLVVPAGRVDDYDPDPGTKVLAYGDESGDPTVAHYERDLWSENPTTPPEEVSPDAAPLATESERYAHGILLDAAERIVSDYGIGEDDTVALRAPLSEPEGVVAGVLAPLSAGASILVDRTQTGTVGVGRDAPEERQIDPDSVL